MEPVRIGVVGCGNISGIYFTNLQRYPLARVIACSDLDIAKAQAASQTYGIPMVLAPDDLVTHPDVDLVLNLTVPKAHASVSLMAMRARKHVYTEKPLAVSRQQGSELIGVATSQNVRIGSAPDTFLGGSHQTCRDLIDSGAIGEPVGAAAFMLCHGHETWHPSPEFYYEIGGGPMMDMGPYYLTALVNLLGPIHRVTGANRITFSERIITSQPKHGRVIRVETPTHIHGVMEFASGAIGSIITSFDVWHTTLPRIEIWGTEGSLLVPDPNGFGGTPLMMRRGDRSWSEVPVTRGFTSNSRGVGLVDMILGIATGGPHRASGALALHVLDAMQGFNDAADASAHYDLVHRTERPLPLPAGLIAEADGLWVVNAGT